ncbi:hypothetical protein FRC10_001805 [Ceratobasidium sp. 414]|nr:hypothetical protein FRC10_001805 [Ceratobasidium sp. 414]
MLNRPGTQKSIDYTKTKYRLVEMGLCSSKACDEAKYKCEKSPDSAACHNCVLFSQGLMLVESHCGCVDTIEAHLHRFEVLLGIVIAPLDPCTQLLTADLITDLLAWHITTRVDKSPFGGHRHNQHGIWRFPKSRVQPPVAE